MVLPAEMICHGRVSSPDHCPFQISQYGVSEGNGQASGLSVDLLRIAALIPRFRRKIKGPDIAQVSFIPNRFIILQVFVCQYGLQNPLACFLFLLLPSSLEESIRQCTVRQARQITLQVLSRAQARILDKRRE